MNPGVTPGPRFCPPSIISSCPPRPSATREPTVFLASDTRLWLEGLTQLLLAAADFKLIGTGSCDKSSIEEIAALDPTAILVDMNAKEALFFAHAISNRCVEPRIVAVGMAEVPDHLLELVEWGISGCTLREASITELVRLVESIIHQEASSTKPRVLAGPTYVAGVRSPLSSRELQILECVAQGLSNKEIARVLGIRPQTVKNHLHSVLSKLRVHTRGQAAALARKPAGRSPIAGGHRASIAGASQLPPSCLMPSSRSRIADFP